MRTPVPDTLPAPASLGSIVWFWSDLDNEPTMCLTLVDALANPPATPEALVLSMGIVLASSSKEVARWELSQEGRERLLAEQQYMADSDADTILSLVFAEDFAQEHTS